MNVRLAALGALLAAALGACGTARQSTAEQASPIISGVPSPSPGDDAVVLLRPVGTTETICTGTLVAPNLVVTARHCVSYGVDGSYQCTLTGDLVEGPDGGGHLGADLPAASIEIHTGAVAGAAPAALGKQVLSTLSLTSCIDDLAYVVLDGPLDGPVAALRIGKQTRVGESVTLVGYGKQHDGDFDWHTQPRAKLPGQIIAAVGPDSAEGIVPMLVPRTFEIHGASACDGDSGGPALSEKTGAIVGVYSNRLSVDCKSADSVHRYTNLAPFGPLALQAFAAAGAEPMREPTGLAMGEVCQEAGDCEHSDCAAGSDGTPRCTVACGAVAPCPTGYSCVPTADASAKVCMPNALPPCPCGSPNCPACDAGVALPPAPTEAGGCTIGHGAAHPGVGCWVVCLAAAVAGAARLRKRRSTEARSTGRRARCRRPANSRCPTRIRTAG